MIRLFVYLDAPSALLAADAFGAGALVRAERAAGEAGPYAEIATAAIVADQHRYTFWDPDGSETSWYRWRVSNAGNTVQSAYSDPLQGDDLADPSVSGRYATVDDVLGTYKQAITDEKTLNRIDQALETATQNIIDLLGFDFFRHPQSGAEARVFESIGGSSLCIHDGVIPDSVTLVELRGSVHSDYTSLVAADWEQERPERPGFPAFHLHLTGLSTWGRFPGGRQLVRVTAAFGWPEIPASVREATVHRARQLLAWDPSRPGGPVGPEELGAPVGPNRMPDTMYRLRHDYGSWELGLAACSL
jgi:hypothetical protein